MIWTNEPYSDLTIRNNHVIARTTATPRKEGFFGFHPECDFGTIQIVDNIIEYRREGRPLLRNDESSAATIRNNTLVNVSDTIGYSNPQTGAPAGLRAPLLFRCGVHGGLTVEGWETRATGRSREGAEAADSGESDAVQP